jgi:lipoyl(octanoyl) transferase
LVVYPLISLSRRKLGVRTLVTAIEQAIVRTLAGLGIESASKADAPGVYVGDAKIASLGLRIRRGCSFHGLALNVDMDLEPFTRINPCGYAGLAMCQVSDFVRNADVADIEKQLVSQLITGLNFTSADFCEGW